MPRHHQDTSSTILKIIVNYQAIDYSAPHSKLPLARKNGSGWLFDISQNREILSGLSPEEAALFLTRLKEKTQNRPIIVTNAHVIAEQTSISILIPELSTHYAAKVLAVANWLDLAFLLPEDKFFEENIFEKYFHVNFDIPPRGSIVSYGYPINGKDLAITKGDISRVTGNNYSFSQERLLNIELTANINPGNSGGPIVNIHDDVVGITHQGIQQTKQGYAIPTFYLRTVCQQLFVHNRIIGAFVLPIHTQTLTNPYQREFLQLNTPEADAKGVLVTNVAPLSQMATSSILVSGDILLAVTIRNGDSKNTFEINSEGETKLNSHVVPFHILTHMAPAFSEVILTIMRNGKQLNIPYQLSNVQHQLTQISSSPSSFAPRYFYRHGVLFTEFHHKFIKASINEKGTYNGPQNLFSLIGSKNFKTTQNSSFVYLQFLNDHSIGYDRFFGAIVTHVNDRPVKNIHSIKHALNQADLDDSIKTILIRTTDSDVNNIFLPKLSHQEEERNCRKYAVYLPTNLAVSNHPRDYRYFESKSFWAELRNKKTSLGNNFKKIESEYKEHAIEEVKSPRVKPN